ncbi:MAG: efflux transporter outer membrane subunit [Dongiaceae bacterium]
MRFCFLAVFLLCACSLTPHWLAPDVNTPKNFSEKLPPEIKISHAKLEKWWESFEDPVLTRVLDQALKSNLDLKIAAARIREVRAVSNIAYGDLFPTIDATGAAVRRRGSENAFSGSGATSGQVTNLYSAGFDASWELDFFGQNRSALAAARADAKAAEEAYRNTMVSMLAEVARVYVNIRSLQKRLDLNANNIDAAKKTLDLTTQRVEVGLSPDTDRTRAQALLSGLEAQRPQLEAALKQESNNLMVLLGKQPGVIDFELQQKQPIPEADGVIPAGLPSDLLQRRPDIRQAERALEGESERIGVARADWFPRFSLTGTFALQSQRTSNLFDFGSRAFSVGPGVVWNVFDAGRIRNNIKAQTARQEQALSFYEKTVLQAFADVETSVASYSKELERRGALTDTVIANQRTTSLNKQLYEQGLTDFLSVLDSERELNASRDALAVSTQQATLNLIALYKALGGGWEEAPQMPAQISQAR